LNNIDLYCDMVDARRLAYEQRAPRIRERLQKQEAQALQVKWQTYQNEVETAAQTADPLQLATGKEKQQWALLQTVHKRLASLPDAPRYQVLRDKAAWLRGVLYWQIQADYKARLWTACKQLAGLKRKIVDTVEEQRQLNVALGTVRAGFAGYDTRIDALRARILALLPRIEQARGKTGNGLQQLALAELETRQQRLVSYRSQARYALARSYDQLSRTDGKQP